MKFLKEKIHSDCDGFENPQEKNPLMELQNLKSCDALGSIIANVTWTNPVSNVLFMGKYLIFLLDNLVPIGEYFQSTFVICAVKPKKLSEQEAMESLCDISASSPLGNPLLVQFENIVCPSPESRNAVATHSVLLQLNKIYDLYPLSIRTGKQLLFICSKFENHYKLPFISICHGNRTGSLILFGAGGKNNAFRLKQLNQGCVSSLKNLPSIQDLKTSHKEGLPPSLTSESCIETRVSAIYEFLGIKSDNSNLVPIKGAHLSVQSSWSVPRALLEPIPIECICFAKLNNAAGDDESGAFVRYKEIKLLKALQQFLKTGIMTWISPKSLDVVLLEINELVNEERKKMYSRKYPKLSEDDLETAIAKERMFLSLPDKLWLIMKNCSSVGDLIAAIQHIYKVFAELNIIFPVAHADDLSTVSKDVISMFDNKLVYCPQLDQKRAAELLLEIGVEKMRRDYYDYFISHGFITQDLFDHFKQPELLSSEAVTCLEKLHSVLELILVCKMQLNLRRSILNEFARNALKWYTTIHEIDLQHVFTFHIPTFDILPVLNMMRPVVWELSLKSGDKNFMKQSCHRFVTAATHDHIYASENYDPKLMLKGASYVYSTGTLIEDNVVA